MDDLSMHKIDFKSFNQELSCININYKTVSSCKKSASISISFDPDGMRLEFPKYKSSSQTYSMRLTKSDVLQVLVYCDENACSFISIITSAKLVEEIEKNLKTFKIKSPYYNPDIECAKQLKISFLLQNVSENVLEFLHNVYDKEKVQIIEQKDAYDLLKSSEAKNSNASQPLFSRSLIYPSVGGIQVKCEDIAQLAHGKPLNDTIIEFYLKYIYFEKISSDLQVKTHIFSTFFYECLQRALKQTAVNGSELKTFERLNTWTKNVDIFSKDFIFIPINKRQHWYLAVICFLSRLLKKSGEEILIDDDNDDDDSNEIEETSELPTSNLESSSRKTREQNKTILNDKNKPCICFFDSSDDSLRLSKEKTEVANTLKEFLKILWKNKSPDEPCQWDNLLYLKARCPQQRNKYDCGIFLLQYVQSFFQTPIACFQEPLPDLKNWFPPVLMKHKRTKIRNLISDLKEKQKDIPISLDESCHFIDHMEVVD